MQFSFEAWITIARRQVIRPVHRTIFCHPADHFS
jgi:hypothetical protein